MIVTWLLQIDLRQNLPSHFSYKKCHLAFFFVFFLVERACEITEPYTIFVSVRHFQWQDIKKEKNAKNICYSVELIATFAQPRSNYLVDSGRSWVCLQSITSDFFILRNKDLFALLKSLSIIFFGERLMNISSFS